MFQESSADSLESNLTENEIKSQKFSAIYRNLIIFCGGVSHGIVSENREYHKETVEGVVLSIDLPLHRLQ